MFGVYEGEILALVFVSMRRNVQIFPVGKVRLGGNFMGAKLNKDKLIANIAKLAFSNPTDAVQLAFLPSGSDLSGMDLRLVTDVKIGEKGGSQVKLVDKLELIRLLAELTEGDGDGETAATFFQALAQAGEDV